MSRRKLRIVGLTVAAALLVIAAGAYFVGSFSSSPRPTSHADARPSAGGTRSGGAFNEAVSPAPDRDDKQSVTLTDQQLIGVKVQPARLFEFPVEKRSVGSIDFNQEMSVQVFTPYQGRILSLHATVGDDVKKGQTLFTIDSPDLLQAESTLITAAGVLDLQNRTLARAKMLYETRAISQRELEQATSDQQTAEGALRAARNAVRIFGKSDAEIDRVIADRRVDSSLIVPSPLSGRITARNAAPGLFVQPGNAPAPYTVADIDTMWMLANVAEDDSPALRVGQVVAVAVNAFPGRVFDGKITTIGASVDPTTRRVLVRSEVRDPRHELLAGMFATFAIRVGDPVSSPAVPLDGVVREGDGTMVVWVTTDRRRFVRRIVKIGIEHDGYRQILEGLRADEIVATEGALFLSNELTTASR